MAFIRGEAGYLSLDGTEAIEIRTLSYSVSGDEEDTSTWGMSRISTVNQKVTGTVTAYANHMPGTVPTQDPGQSAIVVGDTVACVYRPNGTGSGKPELSANIVINTEEVSHDVAGLVELSFNFTIEGATDWTRTAQA